MRYALLVDSAGIVEHPHPDGVAVPPEVLVVLLKRCPYFAQPMRGDDKRQFFILRVVHVQFRG